jgi:hypothetical protein
MAWRGEVKSGACWANGLDSVLVASVAGVVRAATSPSRLSRITFR